jgi:hypothetical protein
VNLAKARLWLSFAKPRLAARQLLSPWYCAEVQMTKDQDQQHEEPNVETPADVVTPATPADVVTPIHQTPAPAHQTPAEPTYQTPGAT